MGGTRATQKIAFEGPRGRVVTVDSAYDADERNRGRDVVVNASYAGVLPARFVASHAPRGAIGVDCGIGLDGAGIAGLPFLEARGIPAAAAAIATVILGDGERMHDEATISRVNAQAAQCGVVAGMPVAEAARLMLEVDPVEQAPDEVTNRTVMALAPDGGAIICTDSIAFGLEEDRGRNVLVTAGHTGRSAVPYLRRTVPRGFICSDGGGGKEGSGTAGLEIVAAEGMAGATVDARTARMGDGLSTYRDGVISACNGPARERGVAVGQPAREAAAALLGITNEESEGSRDG
jgi:hypothetical protein